jgi:hypothetical protein
MKITTKEIGINSKIELKEIDNKHLAIVKKIKSRILKKDALKIIEITQKIKENYSYEKFSLICRANICSKSIKILTESEIDIIIEE